MTNLERHALELLLGLALAVEGNDVEVIAVRVSHENVARFRNVNSDRVRRKGVVAVLGHELS